MTDHTRALLEQALEALDNIPHPPWRDKELADAIRAALAAPDDIATEMSTVADQYAHKLALDLECVLADYSGTWYDAAMTTLGAYRKAMNAIHERESPTFMGEPVLSSEELANHEKTSGSPIEAAAAEAIRAELAKPSAPAWHDAPTEPGIWLCDEGGPDCYTYTAHNIVLLNDPALKDDECRWYGPIPQDGEKS